MKARVDDVHSAGELVADRYRIERELGRGGMAIAYAAYDTLSGRMLALKRLLPSSPDANRNNARLFEQEFLPLQQLSHPRVVEVYDFRREEAGGAFYTMESLDGGDLLELSPLPPTKLCALLSDVASALSLLHSRRLVHRDVTPRNVRCSSDGHPKLIDFGGVVPFGPVAQLVGTPPYLPPEAVMGEELDGRADLFALGAIAYFALTRRHAYPARSLDALQTMWGVPLQSPSYHAPDVPKALDALISSPALGTADAACPTSPSRSQREDSRYYSLCAREIARALRETAIGRSALIAVGTADEEQAERLQKALPEAGGRMLSANDAGDVANASVKAVKRCEG